MRALFGFFGINCKEFAMAKNKSGKFPCQDKFWQGLDHAQVLYSFVAKNKKLTSDTC
ncbi:MAG: hypothetical protein IKW83_05925 [Muribaculaceae bacterium]|nr:hypothetical protein [Muribaculaceae bacterium]